MAETDDVNLDEEEQTEEADQKKKKGGLGALLPTILKFAAIGLGALVFIVTVSVVTYMLMSRGGQSQTVIPENSPYMSTRPEYSTKNLGAPVRTSTKDEIPYSVVVDMRIAYDLNDNAANTELTSRTEELRDFVRSYFRNKTAAELQPENEGRLKRDIIELLNTRYLNVAKVRAIYFDQLDVMSSQ
ncbi:MAG: flagellar basal body-associated FliL family protein [Treponema sp.]|jgi:flagellar FliL protein|nr:flagellar basal body-associated FliL family protein [Treponema sp.]